MDNRIMNADEIRLRAGLNSDAVSVAALAVQVFLDTYASDGVRADLAREAFAEYSPAAFSVRLVDPTRAFLLAEHADAVLGFAELLVEASAAPGEQLVGAELVRLYVQPRSQRCGLGRRLIQSAEHLAGSLSHRALWLTVWDGNTRALEFYRAMGYTDIGATVYEIEGKAYGNRVITKSLTNVPSSADCSHKTERLVR